MIELNNVEIGYTTSLLKVEFSTLEKGKAYALIGENGSGKSTFLKTLAGQLSTYKGELFINGKSTSDLPSNSRAKLVAFVPSRFPEISTIRTTDFIGLGRTPYLNALGRLSVKDRRVVDESMRALNIEHLEKKMISELSDGEKQLCALARAICQETPIILLDEPTSFLDYKNKKIVLDKMNELAKNKCILFSSHDLEMVSATGSQFLVVNKKKQSMVHINSNISVNELSSLAFD